MAWIAPVAMGLGGMLASKSNYDALRDQQKQDQEMNAIQTEFSPWLNTNYRQVTNPGSKWGQMLGGGLSGAMMGMGINKGFGIGQNPVGDTKNYFVPWLNKGEMASGQTMVPYSGR